MPAAVKAELRADIAALVKALQTAQKGAAAGNKAKAVSETVAAAATAASSGDKCLSLRVDVRRTPNLYSTVTFSCCVIPSLRSSVSVHAACSVTLIQRLRVHGSALRMPCDLM